MPLLTMTGEPCIADGKRILLCVHQFFPQFSAGTEVLTLSTAQSLRACGYTVEIVTAALTDRQTPGTSSYLYQGFQVHQLEITYLPGRFSSDAILNEYRNTAITTPFRRLLDEFKPDLVHFFHLKNLTTAALQACFDYKIPTVYTPTDYWITCRACQLVKPWGKEECSGPSLLSGNCLKHVIMNRKTGPTRRLLSVVPSALFSALIFASSWLTATRFKKHAQVLRDLANRKQSIHDSLIQIDRILPPTLFIESLLLNSGIPQKKITRLRYGIQPPLIYRSEPTPEISVRRRPAIGFIGTLVDHKGCHVFAQAIKTIADANVDFVIYGDTNQNPEYVKKLNAIIQSDPRVRFMGTFPHQQIGNILHSIDVLVIPSTWRENAPLVLLNAVACGTPVVASNVTGITEYLGATDDVTLFEPGNAEQLAERLVSRLALISDPAHNQSAGRIAGEPMHAYINTLSSVYSSLIHSS
ncbi:glycosyltransferase [Pseudomonas nunensis]|uniref:Glycosyltransferase n=1 Tax=Pseudomonas nunensis TaxID=2961896 RepID=A0ABY5EII1_9PSED|nr:glycosyltransferase [Pseudomonas nunensis]KPN94022.1 hypothetical protein AL066_03925 [Pseudomonas nunensis]MCL5230523.1 glycosyltransferase [Pseudomonas nunensis]UTO15541.1 glycosyltransferase [Pseudomonas nunensis]